MIQDSGDAGDAPITVEKGEVFSIQFGVYTEEEKRRLSVVEVTSSTINYPSGMPRDDGPNSLLLGINSHRTFCKTCNNTVDHCQGHAGIVIFPERYPVYNPLYLVNNDLIKMLRVVCFWCSTPLTSEVCKPATTSKRALPQVMKMPLLRSCPACHFGPTTESYCPECALNRKMEHRLQKTKRRLQKGIRSLNKRLVKRKSKGNKKRLRFERDWACGTVVQIDSWLKHVAEQSSRSSSTKKRVVRQTTCVTCPNPDCGSMCQPGFKRIGSEIVPQWADVTFPNAEVETVAHEPFTPYKCWRILRGIPEKWRREVLHLPAPIPDTFIWRSMLVPPVFIRPSINVRGTNAEEDVTRSIADVVKNSQEIKKKMKILEAATTEEEIRTTRAALTRLHAALQKSANVMVDRDIVASNRSQPMKQSVGHMKPRRTLMGRLTGKTGRLRGSLMSKRVGRCGRGVATPHPTCDIDQVGIPIRLAKKIPVTETISLLNKEDLLACVRRGSDKIGGAIDVVHTDGTVTNLVGVRSQDTDLIAAKCKIGDRVSRMLRDGDTVIINRQPTLHILGIMAARVFLHDHATIKDRTETEGPFNGDFDGDEKNFHCPQGFQAKAEMLHISHIRHNTIDPADSSPVFVPVQGTMCGMYLMSDVALQIPVELACDMFMECRYARKSPQEAFGPDFASKGTVAACRVLDLLWPSTFTFDCKGVVIRNGRFHASSSQVTKKHMSGSGHLMHLLALNYGEPTIVEFVSDLGRVVRLFMRDFWGFSVSYADILLENSIREKLQEDIQDIVKEANTFADEREQLRVLSQTTEATKSALESSQVYRRSNMRIMIDSGSKGKPVNFEQIAGCLGQQIVGSARPDCDESGRALSCFRAGDTDVNCFGFVGNSYIDGMTPAQNSFHARGAREGVTETQCGTAKSGYLQRRFQKLLENVKIVFDVHGISVRNGRNAVVLLFFVNGLFTKYVEPVQLDCMTEALPPFQDDAERSHPADVPPLASRFPKLYQYYQKLDVMRAGLLQSRIVCSATGAPDFQYMVPLNVERWIHAQYHARCDNDTCPVEGQTDDWIVSILKMLDDLPVQFHAFDAFKYHVGRTLIEMWLDDAIYRLSVPLLRKLKDHIESRIAKAAAEAGTALGPLVASFISKNVTQAILNSFHSAGSGSAETKTGIDRAKELVEVSLTGVAQVRVRARIANVNRNKAALKAAAQSLMPVTLADIVEDTRIVDPATTAVTALHLQKSNPLLNREALPQNAWSVAYVLDRAKLQKSSLTVAAAARSLSTTVTAPFHFSPWHSDTSLPPTLTIYFSSDMFSEPDVHAQSILLLDVLLAGYRQVLWTNVIASSTPGQYEIQATVKPLKKNDQPSALLPFFQNQEFFDVKTLRCSSLPIMFAVYGIEAALVSLFAELYATVCTTGFVHAQHVFLLCVIICITGQPLAVTRHGMKAKGTDVLQLASFEQPRAVFTTAALHGDASVNVKHCLSSSSIIGGVAGVGTGTVETVTDPYYKVKMEETKVALNMKEHTNVQEACNNGKEHDIRMRRSHRDLENQIRAMPVALRPTQFWNMEEDVHMILHDFRKFSVEWITTHPQIVQRAAQVRLQSDFQRQEEHARRQRLKIDGDENERASNQVSHQPKLKRRKLHKHKRRHIPRPKRKRKRAHKRQPLLFDDNPTFDTVDMMENEFTITSFDEALKTN